MEFVSGFGFSRAEKVSKHGGFARCKVSLRCPNASLSTCGRSASAKMPGCARSDDLRDLLSAALVLWGCYDS